MSTSILFDITTETNSLEPSYLIKQTTSLNVSVIYKNFTNYVYNSCLSMKSVLHYKRAFPILWDSVLRLFC